MLKLPCSLRFRRKASESFGLDIGSSAIKVVQLHEDGHGYEVSALGVVPLRPDIIADGAIKDAPAVVAAIAAAVAKAGIKLHDAVIGVSGRELIIKKIEIPQVPEKELAGAIQLEAEHHIPFSAEEVFLDYHVVGLRDSVMDVILVAVKKSKVIEYATVVEEAGLTAAVVDVDGFAVENQYELNATERPAEAVALIDIGASVMKTNVIRGGASIFARDIPFGGNRYTEAIASALSLPFTAAEVAKLGRDGASASQIASAVAGSPAHVRLLCLDRGIRANRQDRSVRRLCRASGTHRIPRIDVGHPGGDRAAVRPHRSRCLRRRGGRGRRLPRGRGRPRPPPSRR